MYTYKIGNSYFTRTYVKRTHWYQGEYMGEIIFAGSTAIEAINKLLNYQLN